MPEECDRVGPAARAPRGPAVLGLAACLLVVVACGEGAERGSARSAGAVPAAQRHRLLLIGLDAADERMITDGVRAGRLPHFARMIHEGAAGPLRTHRPILSPIIWTTMATGLTPDRHGVLDFISLDERGRTVPVSRTSRRAPAFWNILGERGVSCAVVGWLATYPAEKVNGWIVSDRFTIHPFEERNKGGPVDPSGRTYPAGLFKELQRANVDPSAVSDTDLAEIFGAPPVRDGEDTVERRELRVIEAVAKTYTAAAIALDQDKRPDLTAVYFEAIDRLMHLFGDAMPPPLPGVPSSKAARYGGSVERFYVAMDARLGEMIDRGASGAAPPTVMVVSDHGFKLGAERPRHPALRGDIFAAEWHKDPGVILAWGPGVRRGVRLEGADIYDIAPTVLAFFGAPASDEMRGHVLEQIFEPGFLPPAQGRVAAYRQDASAPPPGGPPHGSEADEREILENLKALGYVGGGDDADVRASSNLATFFLEEKQYDRAIDIYKKILTKDPGDLIALYNLGYAYKELGSPSKGAESFERLLKDRPDYMEARLVLAECYIALGKPDAALALLLEKQSDGRDDPSYQNHLGTVLASAKRPHEAGAAFERAIGLRPAEASAYLNLARLRASEGDRAGAIAILERAERDAPGDTRVASRLAELNGSPADPQPRR